MLDSFFSNKCQAYVDENGRALTGAALEAARHDPNARRCGHSVPLRAKFCSKCHSPAPKAWWRCGSCGKWIGQESENCPHCGHTQDLSSRISLDNGHWRKGDDVFAQRVELNDVAAMFTRGLVISEGQCAILLGNGCVADVLPPGKYAAADLVDLDKYAKSGDSKSLIMVDLGEIAYPVRLNGLKSKDDLNVDLECRVVVRFNPENAEKFISNLMCQRESVYVVSPFNSVVSYEAIARNYLLKELEIGVRDVCNGHTIDELFKDAALRVELEDHVKEYLKRSLYSLGLQFIRLAEVDFIGDFYDRLREMSGDVERNRRELEVKLRLDELMRDAEKRKALGADNLDDYLEQLALEKDMKDIMRADEISKIKEAFERDMAIAELETRYRKAKKEQTDVHELEKIDAEHDEELKRIQKAGEIERRQSEHAELLRQKLAEQNASLEYERIELLIQKEREQAALELASQKLDLEDKKGDIQDKHEAARAETLKELDILTRISLARTPAEMHYLMKVNAQMLRSGKDPMQLLAEAAADGNSAAAEALKNMSADKIAMLEEMRRAAQASHKEEVERLERMYNSGLEAVAKAATGNTSTNTTQIIK